MPIGGLLGSRPIQTLLAPGDAYHSTAAVLSAVDAIAASCAASIEFSSVGTAGEWPLKLVKLGADAPSKRRVLLTFGGDELRHLAPVGDRPHLEQPAAVEPAEAVVAHPSASAAAVGEELAREEVAEHAE